jgi:conjugal transfer/entry exclusion protein
MKDLMSIDLSPQELLSLHISISSHALLNQSYSNLLLSQQLLTSLSMDPGLTVKIKAYQNQLRQQAHTFKQSTMSELIGLFTKASNFSTLVTTVDGIFSTEDPQSSQKGGEMVAALATVAQSYQVAAQAVHTQFSATRETLEPLMNNFSETVSAIEQGLGAEAKQQAQTITALNEAIAKNIQGIVDAGIKAGSGVVQLGQAIVAAVPLGTTGNKPKDPPPAKPKSAGDQTEYMISGIQAISAGASGAHQAISDLKANYVKLAAAYQALATANALLSVAKSVHAQAQLFVETYALTAQRVALLPAEWSKVANAYLAATPVIRDISELSDMKQIKQVISLSAEQWQKISKVIENAKANYAGNNILPEM